MIEETGTDVPMLCPDTKELYVKGGESGNTNFALIVDPTDKASEEGVVDYTLVYTREVSHYFNADFYNEHGYLDSVTLSQDIIYMVSADV